jgi:hypothetical protein
MMEFLTGILLRLIVWILLLPVVLILATPFILPVAAFLDGPYWDNVRAVYRGMIEGWFHVDVDFLG